MNERKDQRHVLQGVGRSARMWSAAALATASVLLCGCCVLGRPEATELSTGEPIYYNGKLEQTLRAPMDAVYKASVKMLKALELPIMEERADTKSGLLRSESVGGKPIRIELESLGVYTRVTIQAGLAGDKALSLLILSKIKDRM